MTLRQSIENILCERAVWTDTEDIAARVERPMSEVAAALASMRAEGLVDWRRRDASAWGPARTRWAWRS